MFEDFLPIGTVVLLKEGTKKLMITGYKAFKANSSNVYDYIGVLFPEGFLGNEYNFLFNHDAINDVVFFGYNNPERKDFAEFMKKKYEVTDEAEKQTQ